MRAAIACTGWPDVDTGAIDLAAGHRSFPAG